jgi:hypothetical protein
MGLDTQTIVFGAKIPKFIHLFKNSSFADYRVENRNIIEGTDV